MLWFTSLYYEILIVVLSLFFSAVASAFQLFPCKFCLQFSGLRKRNFTWNPFSIKKICWSIPCLHPPWKVHTWIEICASLNHRKKTKEDGSRLIPRKDTETLVLSNDALCCLTQSDVVFHFVRQFFSQHSLLTPTAAFKPNSWQV